MDTPALLITDSVELVRRLDPDELRKRIADLDEERQALVVLLRAALRRTAKPVREAAGA
jgi:hypothetical protein